MLISRNNTALQLRFVFQADEKRTVSHDNVYLCLLESLNRRSVLSSHKTAPVVFCQTFTQQVLMVHTSDTPLPTNAKPVHLARILDTLPNLGWKLDCK